MKNEAAAIPAIYAYRVLHSTGTDLVVLDERPISEILKAWLKACRVGTERHAKFHHGMMVANSKNIAEAQKQKSEFDHSDDGESNDPVIVPPPIMALQDDELLIFHGDKNGNGAGFFIAETVCSVVGFVELDQPVA